MNQTLHQQLVQLHGRAKAWLYAGRCEQFYPTFGICENLPRECRFYGPLFDLMGDWPGSSGTVGFPVPHPAKEPEDAFVDSNSEQMWNPEHEYARNRWALLEWLIEQTAPTLTKPESP